ncbi:hypothetical protein CR205_12580 [Alteribacter lacisalsi]|uniref:Uncharacterized protein n=1 Tax=Alteribacter lacisalsi TaxID=2045244 RepID=A0A2W0H3Z1_9BACI|nr:hypothetical protein [Alteribacter lacisalsi]PYZ96544.1 hypothetical protein CR205_12580 [Alteribacter lacisalsi]
MNKKIGISAAALSVVLAGCITIGDEDTGGTEETDPPEENTEESDTEAENEENADGDADDAAEEDAVEEGDPDSEDSGEDEDEREGLALRELDVNEFTLNLDTPDGYDPDVHRVVEYEQTLFFAHEITAELLDLDIRYDADNRLAEVFEGESQYTHETVHPEHESEVLEVNQFWSFDKEDYWTPENEDYIFDFLEYNGQLFIPERVMYSVAQTPVHYDRQNGVIELGLASTEESIAGVDFDHDRMSNVTERESITFEGEDIGGGFEVEFVDRQLGGEMAIDTSGNRSEARLVIAVTSTDNQNSVELTITTGHDELAASETITVSEGEKYELELSINGSHHIHFEAEDALYFYLTGEFQ